MTDLTELKEKRQIAWLRYQKALSMGQSADSIKQIKAIYDKFEKEYQGLIRGKK